MLWIYLVTRSLDTADKRGIYRDKDYRSRAHDMVDSYTKSRGLYAFGYRSWYRSYGDDYR